MNRAFVQILRSHAMQLIGRGIMEGRATLGLIQSILCQIYWKVRASRPRLP